MANALRLMLLFLAFFSATASAVITPGVGYYYGDRNDLVYPTADAACTAAAAWWLSQNSSSVSGGSYTRNDGQFCYGDFQRPNGGPPLNDFAFILLGRAPGACPVNSVQTGASCTCSAGYKESNGQCIKDGICGFLEGKSVPGLPRIEADYGKQSASWAAGKIGGKGLVCTPEQCQAQGTVTGCVAGQGEQGTTVCYVSEPKYTGESCKKDDKPGDKNDNCPAGTKPSATNPNICEPLNTTCPAGYEPSKYAEGVCIPVDPSNGPKECEDPKDPSKKVPCEGKPNECPKGYVPSAYVKNVCIPAEDGETTDKDGNKTTCKNGICVTTKPDGSTVPKPKVEFCKENPENDLCKEGSKDTFNGSCEMNFQCQGDVLQCAIAQEQHRRNCQFFVTSTPESGVFENARAEQQQDVLSMTAQTVDLAAHIEADPIITGSCPADMVIPVDGHEIRFPLSQFCPYFNYLGLIVMVMTAVTCLRILGKD